MRFAWLREKSSDPVPAKAGLASRLIMAVYNIVWWIPIVLPFTKLMDYRTGFAALFVITVFRSVAVLIRTNLLTLEQAEVFPFRAP